VEIALSLNALFHPQVAQAVEHADAPLGVHCAFCLPPHLAISSTTVPTILNMRKSVLLASLSTHLHQNVIGLLVLTVATDQSLFNLIPSFSQVEVEVVLVAHVLRGKRNVISQCNVAAINSPTAATTHLTSKHAHKICVGQPF